MKQFTGVVTRPTLGDDLRVEATIDGRTAYSVIPRSEAPEFAYGDRVTVVWMPAEDNLDTAAALEE